MHDSIIRGLLGPLRGNLRHFIDWRHDNWPAVASDPQVVQDLTTLYFLAGVP